MTKASKLPTIKLIDGNKVRVDENGLTTAITGTPPRPAQVRAAHRWLIERIGGEGFIKTPSVCSYSLKHAAQRWSHQYVSNGALIVAAAMLGYPMRPQRYVIGEPRNVIIGISRRHYENLPESFSAKAAK